MSNGEKLDSLFLVDNKEATVSAINNIKKNNKINTGSDRTIKI